MDLEKKLSDVPDECTTEDILRLNKEMSLDYWDVWLAIRWQRKKD